MGVPSDNELTTHQTILVAAGTFAAEFTEAELVVAVWKINNKLFGLPGFVNEYPDNNKVRITIMGERGLVRRGWFEKCGPLKYRLGVAGRTEVERIKSALAVPRSTAPARRALYTVKLEEAEANWIVRQITSKAFRMYESGMRPAIGHLGALEFWGVAPTKDLNPETIRAAIQKTELTYTLARGKVIAGAISIGNGGEVTPSQIGRLEAFHNWLVNTQMEGINRRYRTFAPKAALDKAAKAE